VSEPLYGPDTVTWRVNREMALLAGGGRALLLQVAHPLVAAGVEQHSNYDTDPWGRLFRTLDVTTKIVFGDTETSAQASRRLQGRHRTVQGTSEDGVPYDARDPDLLVWVWATLVESSIVVYSRLLRPLEPAERHTYYEEQKRFGYACGIPEGHCPDDYADFTVYFDRMVETELRATSAGHSVWKAIERPAKIPRPLLPLFLPTQLITVGLLPPSLRAAQFAFEWGPAREKMFEASMTAVSKAIPLLPPQARYFPEARRAQARWREPAREPRRFPVADARAGP
jgi:uncharacterized protein (DUF2236 family)